MKKILLLSLISITLFSSCHFITGKRVRGNGNVRTEQRSPGSFDAVASHGSFNVYVANGEQSVRIEAEENLLPFIETYVEGSVLHIRTRENFWLRPNREVKILVSSPDFSSIHSYGSGDIIGQSKITDSSKLSLGVSGSADIKMDVESPEIDAEISGSGDINLTGTAKTFKSEIHGSGNVRAMNLQSDEARVEIFGSGNADVFANTKLDVHVAGSGDVRYKGNAQTSSNINGSGSVKKVE